MANEIFDGGGIVTPTKTPRFPNTICNKTG